MKRGSHKFPAVGAKSTQEFVAHHAPRTAASAHRHLQAHTLLHTWSCRTLERHCRANSCEVTAALALSAAVDWLRESVMLLLRSFIFLDQSRRVAFHQMCDTFSAHIRLSHSPSGGRVVKEDRVSDRQSEQSVRRRQSHGIPHAPHRQPLILFLFCVSQWLAVTHHKKSATDNILQ